MSSCRRSLLALVAGLLLVASCSSASSLTEEDRLEAQALVVERAADAMIDLSETDRDCVVDDLGTEDVDGLRNNMVQPVAEAIVDCVGVDLIGGAFLRPQSSEISDASIDCAVGELGRQFVVDLVAGAMGDRTQAVTSDIAIARALAVCLDLDELL